MIGDFSNERITVMGLGHFGGGAGVTRWLAQQGASVLVTDLKPAEQLGESVKAIADLVSSGRVELKLGVHDARDFSSCDLVIANPAVPKPWENRFVCAALDAGVPVTTEIRLLVERIDRRRTIAVTGSAGKSTTTAMIHHILKRAGCAVHFGGNIGGSLLNGLDGIGRNDWVVLEVSSAMLHWLGEGVGWADAPGWSPHVAVLTNITPNHIDWHVSFEHYRESKLNIFRRQREADGDRRVTADDLREDERIVELKIPGSHNQLNARMAAQAAFAAVGIDPIDAMGLLCDFPGLAHRLQLAGEFDGVRFYNDSKSTTPEATTLAVSAFDDAAKVHLIAGGYDKGSDLSPIARLAERIAGLYTIGATGRSLADAASGFSQHCESLERAVDAAMARMKDGDVLLLSPGCASWDQFTNYEQRGDAFVRFVREGHSSGMSVTAQS